MIEINLLPEDMREVTGTPIPRMASIIGGVLCVLVLGFFVLQFQLVAIPNMVQEIGARNVEIKTLEEEKVRVDAILAQIDSLDKKVKMLSSLITNRIRFARVLDRLCSAVNDVKLEGCNSWFKQMNITQDSGTPPPGSIPNAKRMRIELLGYTTGATPEDRAKAVAELTTKLDYRFRIEGVDLNPKDEKLKGIHTEIGAKFYPATLLNQNYIDGMPVLSPTGLDPAVLAAVTVQPSGLDFTINISFELPQSMQMP